MTTENLMNKVVDGGYCVGCGACTAIGSDKIGVEMDEYGFYQAKLNGENFDQELEEKFAAVCPFSGGGQNENAIGKDLFHSAPARSDYIGYYEQCYAGHVAEEPYRMRGSSGGMGAWILAELFSQKMIDYAIHIHGVEDSTIGQGPLYKYSVSKSVNDVIGGSKSTYYPIELSEMLKVIQETAGRYALVGVPCFIKSVRRLANLNPIIKERVVYTVGLVCGHLKSQNYTKYLTTHENMDPDSLENIDFRVKKEGVAANNYYVSMQGNVEGETKKAIRNSSDFYGASWGYAFFMYSACNFCDDVVAETADISIGDAWLPDYMRNWRGDNVIIVRNKEIAKLLSNGIKEKRLVLDEISEEDVVASQAGGFRQRREALSVRLHEKVKTKKWYPEKRVSPSGDIVSDRLKTKYLLREKLSTVSNTIFLEAYKRQDFDYFKRKIAPYMVEYDNVSEGFLMRKYLKFKHIVKILLGPKLSGLVRRLIRT